MSIRLFFSTLRKLCFCLWVKRRPPFTRWCSSTPPPIVSPTFTAWSPGGTQLVHNILLPLGSKGYFSRERMAGSEVTHLSMTTVKFVLEWTKVRGNCFLKGSLEEFMDICTKQSTLCKCVYGWKANMQLLVFLTTVVTMGTGMALGSTLGIEHNIQDDAFTTYILAMNLIHPPLATFLLLRLTWLSPGCTTSPWNRYVILFSTLLKSWQSMVACLPSLLSRLSLPQFDMQETVWAQIILKVGHNHWNSETNFDVKNISHDMHVLPSISCQWETQSFISRPPPWPWPSWQWCWHCPWLKWKAPFLASLSASTSRFDDFWMDSCLQLSVLDLDSIRRQEILMWLALTNWGDWNRQWRGHSCFLWNLHLLHLYFSTEDQQQDKTHFLWTFAAHHHPLQISNSLSIRASRTQRRLLHLPRWDGEGAKNLVNTQLSFLFTQIFLFPQNG